MITTQYNFRMRKLRPEDPTYACFPSNYTVLRKERPNTDGGGVFVAVKSDIPVRKLPEIATDPEDESLWASIHLTKKKILFVCAYYKFPAAPVSRLDLLFESMLKIFDMNKKSHPNIIISGDFNCGDIDWNYDPPVISNHTMAPLMNKLLDLISDHALTQYVSSPTRPASMKTLDLVLSSVPSLVSNVRVVPGMSDHDIVMFNILLNPNRALHPRRKIYLYDKADLTKLHKHSSAWSKYCDQRNKVVKLLKSAHNDYLNDVVGGSLDKNPKRFWSYIKHSQTETIGIPTLRHGESIYISDKEKAEALNYYFQSVFTKDNGLLPPCPLTTCTSDNMSDIVFSHNGVLKQLATLNPSKSAVFLHAAYVTSPLRSPACWHISSNRAMTWLPYQVTG